MDRRSFLTGFGLLIAAPAIIRVAKLMPIRVAPSSFSVDRRQIFDCYPSVRKTLEALHEEGAIDQYLIDYHNERVYVIPTRAVNYFCVDMTIQTDTSATRWLSASDASLPLPPWRLHGENIST